MNDASCLGEVLRWCVTKIFPILFTMSHPTSNSGFVSVRKSPILVACLTLQVGYDIQIITALIQNLW
jgi:hypothetical protein